MIINIRTNATEKITLVKLFKIKLGLPDSNQKLRKEILPLKVYDRK